MQTWGSKSPEAVLFPLQEPLMKRAAYLHTLEDGLLSWEEVSSKARRNCRTQLKSPCSSGISYECTS
jgi:hypothetical protein